MFCQNFRNFLGSSQRANVTDVFPSRPSQPIRFETILGSQRQNNSARAQRMISRPYKKHASNFWSRDLENNAKGRAQLLRMMDAMVEHYNTGDFESLVTIIVANCSKEVSVVTDLEVPRCTDDGDTCNHYRDSVATDSCRNVPYVAEENSSSSIALIWMVLHTIYPDGIMKLVDKRICYRPNRSRYWNSRVQVGYVLSVSPSRVMEAVVELYASCTFLWSLQHTLVLAIDATRQCLELTSGDGASVTSIADQPELQGSRSNLETANSSLDDTSTTCKRVQQHGSAAAASLKILSGLVAKYTGEAPQDRFANYSNGTVCAVGGTTENRKWRYLIEFRLQFDEHDLVTLWTTTMLAAEPDPL
jgi:hypothetical protein